MRTFVLILAVCFLISCGDAPKKVGNEVVNNPVSASDTSLERMVAEAPYMSFEQNIHDFGKLTDGDVVTHLFTFTNTGKTDLIISNAYASCGCTVPEYPKEPIKPNAKGEIKVVFNSKGKIGVFEKSVTLTANTIPNETTILIKGEVLAQSNNN